MHNMIAYLRLSNSLIEFSNELLNLETSDSELYQHDIISETMLVNPITNRCQWCNW